MAITYSHIVIAFSFDNLFLSFRTSSQNLRVVKPSVIKVIFLSSAVSTKLSFLGEDMVAGNLVEMSDDDDGVCIFNILDIDLFERLAI